MEITAYNYAPPNMLTFNEGYCTRRLYTWGGWRCRFQPGEPRVYPAMRYYKHQVACDVPHFEYNNTPFSNKVIADEAPMKLVGLTFGQATLDYDGTCRGYYGEAAYARAYGDFMDKVFQDSSSLGVSIAEGREAIASIVDRASRLGRSYKALRRGDFRRFLKELGGRPLEKHKHTRWTRPKDASSLWLEYWLGWAPLVGDIHASTKVLASSHLFPDVYIKTWKGVQFPSSLIAEAGDVTYSCEDAKGQCKVGLGFRVTVNNPNAYLAARLGLHDPASIAWAVVPFSFVIDWFANIGQVLGSMEFGSAGVTYSDGWISMNNKIKGTLQGKHVYTPSRQAKFQTSFSGFWSRRALITKPSRVPLIIRLPRGLSATRGATAISLLVSIFTKG